MSTNFTVTDNLINTLKDTYKGEIVKSDDGLEFATRALSPLPQATIQKQPIIAALAVNTLQGIVDYLDANPDNLDLERVMLHVATPDAVGIYSSVFGEAKQRETYLVANSPNMFGDSFSFDEYMNVEDFIIGLKTLFVQTSDIEKITAIVGNVVDGIVKTVSDDGFTQTVDVKKGIRRAEVDVPNLFMLRPFRTFREVAEQPESPFVLRLQGGNGALPQCALFEADGGSWKLQALKSIKEFFDSKNVTVPIIC